MTSQFQWNDTGISMVLQRHPNGMIASPQKVTVKNIAFTSAVTAKHVYLQRLTSKKVTAVTVKKKKQFSLVFC
jgi:hypothetical protein